MEKENLIVITAYCPSEEQQKKLEECINSLKKVDYDIALISHTHVSEYIQKKCNYYLYDYYNEVLEDSDLNSFITYQFSNQKIYSKFFQKNFYGTSIIRLISLGYTLGKLFYYKKIHYLEYDCVVKDDSIFEINSKLLDKFDSVLYTSTGNNSGELFGGLHSVSVKNLPKDYLENNKDQIIFDLKNMPDPCIENLTKILMEKSGKVKYLNTNELIEKIELGNKFINRNVNYTFYYDHKIENINFLYYNSTGNIEEVIVIYNEKNLIQFESKRNEYNIRIVCKPEELKNIKVFINNQLMYQKIFLEGEIETLKKNSFIIYN
jgi:hypothetical protein